MLCIPDKTVSDYTKDIQMSEAHGGGGYIQGYRRET